MLEKYQHLINKIQEVASREPRYKLEAYFFVLNALDFTLSRLERHRHVTGQELARGIRGFALDQYGPLARLVLEYWGIKETLDFGRLVFLLIETGLMTKTEEDRLQDFKDVYDFKEAFDKGYEICLGEGEGGDNPSGKKDG